MKPVFRVNANAAASMPQTRFGSGSDADPGQTHGNTTVSLPDQPALTPDLIRRFEELIEEVTQELMQGLCNDRNTCRADAIALLVAASERFENPTEGIESPLKYMLLEEQHRARTLLDKTRRAGRVPTFVRV